MVYFGAPAQTFGEGGRIAELNQYVSLESIAGFISPRHNHELLERKTAASVGATV